MAPSRPVLVVGGSGVVGLRAAQLLRQLQPDLPIAIGGRDPVKAKAAAAAVGGSAVHVDLARPDLGLPADARFAAVVVFVKDDWTHALALAQRLGVPHVSVSSGAFEIGPEVARFVHAPQRAPVVLASQWLAGAVLFPTLVHARRFRALDAIRIGVLLDEQDMGGPAAWADYERITQAGAATLTVVDGKFTWLGASGADGSYRAPDGVVLPTKAYGPLDVLSLAAATGARAIRIELAFAVSASRRAGGAFSSEAAIELDGTDHDGVARRVRVELVHPEGQAPLTGLGVALVVERALGLAGTPPLAPGLYFPDTILEPDVVVAQLERFGARIREVAP